MTTAATPRRAIALQLTASALFAVMATCVGAAHQREPTLHTLVASAGRASVNLVFLLVIAQIEARRSGRAARDLLLGDGRPALWARGGLGAISLLSYFTALSHLGVGEAAFLNNTSAVWVAAVAPFALGEPTSGRAWFAIGASLVGLALLGHPRPEAGDWLGRIAGLISGVGAAGAYLSVRRAARTNHPITIVFYFTALATAVCFSGIAYLGLTLPRDPAVLLLLTGAGLSATLAQLVMTEAYRSGPAATLAATGAASPLLTALLGWAVLGQVPDHNALWGIALLTVSSVVLPFLMTRP